MKTLNHPSDKLPIFHIGMTGSPSCLLGVFVMKKKKPIIPGKKFTRLTVTGNNYHSNGNIHNECVCDCGKTLFVITRSLNDGNVKSCGCLKIESVTKIHRDQFKTHGLTMDENGKVSRIHYIWDNMKQRCYNENCGAYQDYGGRGISICDQWRNDFKSFHDWAKENGYAESLTIERKDVNGNYEPENCTWILKSEQPKNRRNIKTVNDNGVIKTIIQAAKDHNKGYTSIWSRIKNGWSEYDALNIPMTGKFKTKTNK